MADEITPSFVKSRLPEGYSNGNMYDITLPDGDGEEGPIKVEVLDDGRIRCHFEQLVHFNYGDVHYPAYVEESSEEPDTFEAMVIQ